MPLAAQAVSVSRPHGLASSCGAAPAFWGARHDRRGATRVGARRPLQGDPPWVAWVGQRKHDLRGYLHGSRACHCHRASCPTRRLSRMVSHACGRRRSWLRVSCRSQLGRSANNGKFRASRPRGTMFSSAGPARTSMQHGGGRQVEFAAARGAASARCECRASAQPPQRPRGVVPQGKLRARVAVVWRPRRRLRAPWIASSSLRGRIWIAARVPVTLLEKASCKRPRRASAIRRKPLAGQHSNIAHAAR